MKIRKEHLMRAEESAVLPPGTGERLWQNLSLQIAEEPAFKAQHLIYYFGAMLMLLPLTVMVASGFLSLGDAGLLLVALAIGASTFALASRLHKSGRRIAAGTFAVVSLGVLPLALFSFFRLIGIDFAAVPSAGYASFHRHISANYLLIEAMTLAAAVGYLWRFRLPFLMLPVAVALWYVGMDVSSRILGAGLMDTARHWSMFYGVLLMLGAYALERRTRHTLNDFSFWIWIFGAMSFWTALSCGNGDEWAKLGYAGINLAMVMVSVAVGRRVLAVFGALGLMGYLGHLSLSVFKAYALFPLVTLALGAGLVWVGVRWPRIEAAVEAALGRKSAAR